MGIYTDVLANATAWDAGGPDGISVGPDRVITMELERIQAKGVVPYSVACAETDEVQEIGTYNGSVSGGSFTLTFELEDGTTWTTGNTIHNANNSIIQTSINETANSVVTGWAHDDISVAGGSMDTDPVVITYDGDSVKGQDHVQVVINDVDLSGGGTVGDVSTTQDGFPKRPALAVLEDLGIVTTVPSFGSVVGLVANFNREDE